jgi:hypothetical protein
LTQSEVDAGMVSNTATATGVDPSGSPVSSSDSTQTVIGADGAIDLEKTAGEVADVDGNGVDAGDTVAYTLTVTNSGSVTLHGISVTDPMLGEVSCPGEPLAPGVSVTCTAAPYTLTQADVDAGEVDNTAVATGLTPTGQPVVDTDMVGKSLGGKGGLALDKTAVLADANDDGKANPDETITYTFVVTNTGALTITGIAVDDPALVEPATCRDTVLAPGATTTCRATYVVTAADVADGSVKNTATARGRTPGGGLIASPPDSVTVPAGATSPGPPSPPAPPSPPDSPEPAEPPVYLPSTGTSVALALLVAALLVAMGAGALLAGRARGRQ